MRYLTVLILGLLVSGPALATNYTCNIPNGRATTKFESAVCTVVLAELTAQGRAPAVWTNNKCASALLRRAAKKVFVENEARLAEQARSERASDAALEAGADFDTP